MQVVYIQIERSKSENGFIKFDCCHKNSWKIIQMLMLKSWTWSSAIANEEKCRQLNWQFNIDKKATCYLK